jgi:iron(III) transport system substrate-binding protein
MTRLTHPARIAPAALIVALLAAACSPAASTTGPTAGTAASAAPVPLATLQAQAKTESGIVLYGNTPAALFQPVIAAFGKQYPSIKVQYTSLSDDQVFSKYEAEHAQGARTADLVVSSGPSAWTQAVANGVVANVTPTGLGSFPATTSQGHGVYVMSDEPVVLTYSTKLLTPAQVPTSYAQLAADVKSDPKTYSLVSYPISNPFDYGAIYGLIHVLGADKVWSYYDVLGPHTKTYNEGLDGLQQVVQGGAALGYVSSGLAQAALAPYKGLAAYRFMTDATPLMPRGIAVTAGASSPASAQLFLDLLYTTSGQDALCQSGLEATMNGYQPAGGCTASLTHLSTQIPAGTTYAVPLLSQDLSSQQASITARWNKAFGR